MNNIRVEVYRLRVQSYLSQADLADEAGVSVSTISKIETGKTTPSIDTLSKISKALNVPLSELVGEPKPKLDRWSLGTPYSTDSDEKILKDMITDLMESQKKGK